VDVDVDLFMRILAGRLAAVAPRGFSVTVRDGLVWYSGVPGQFSGLRGSGASGTYVRSNFPAYGATIEQRLVGAARQALGELQDFISEATHDPWPGRTAQPWPHAVVRDQVLHLWYGGRDLEADVVLACEPIPLADLQGTG